MAEFRMSCYTHQLVFVGQTLYFDGQLQPDHVASTNVTYRMNNNSMLHDVCHFNDCQLGLLQNNCSHHVHSIQTDHMKRDMIDSSSVIMIGECPIHKHHSCCLCLAIGVIRGEICSCLQPMTVTL